MNNSFKKINVIGGWFCFVFASMVYLLTMEPTASFWDCSEFIATSYKLEVGHPPGAPLFMMISRFFTMFAGPQHAALMVNAMSALASGATIMFLFWSITHLARRAMRKRENELSMPQTIAVIGAGLVGSIAYTFTDTFWFSAVEGEVYALSSFFTAIVFWAILKWENVADEPHANRWLILIAYLTGLAIGVHLLNLLIIPPIVLIYYFRKYSVTKWGVVKALLVSAAILVAAMFIIIPGTIQLGALFDRLFVNTFGLPFNSGITFYAFALFAALAWGVYLTHKKGKVLANTILLCVTVVILGYSSYASVVIRSAANPPMNSNAPNNPYGLLSLLNRDQYGARPLVKGPYYSSPPIAYKEKTAYYKGDSGKYESAQTLGGYEYDPQFEFFFPRMYSEKPSDIKAYQNWVQIKGRQIPFGDETITVPTFAENLKFFFAYQMNFMYWRYFLWNFVGRQSDIQSTGEITDGNWLSGINAVDELFLGPQDHLPSEKAANKGRNTYYFLPFILGIIGLIYQLNRDGRNFTVVMAFFIMTGVAIAVYLNSPPAEPRERDYVFAGSFYAFCMWIGFGVPALYEAFKRWFKRDHVYTAVAATLIGAIVPALLGAKNWDDHDRAGRFVARDFGMNYLKSALPNAIIMNYGDNDTFPLWYAQEVEGVRTDVRVMNMSYLGADWYIDQMKLKSNDSDPVPFTLPRDKYTYRNDYLPIKERFKSATAKQVIDEWIRLDDPVTKVTTPFGTEGDYIPTRKIAIPVNKENAIASGIVKPEDAHLMVDTIYLTLKGSIVTRDQLMLIDLLAHFDWKRPIYFTQAISPGELGLRDYLQVDGFVYRLVPIATKGDYLNIGRVDADYLYDKLMNEFSYGNIDDPKVYADYTVHNNFYSTQARTLYARLAKALLEKGDTTRAIEVLDTGIRKIPFSQIRHNYMSTVPIIEAYYMAGAFDKGNEVLEEYAKNLEENITYYLRFTGKYKDLTLRDVKENAEYLYDLYQIAGMFGQTGQARQIEQYLIDKGIVEDKKQETPTVTPIDTDNGTLLQ
ncbi:DUF2723 domain-containing protein [Alistipes sp. AF48-12]|uniref:glycosyltransferase family 117 protein n=1 Tax=Alistipes sp. AF48-12 TaxID=2291998 RepID=UPI000E4A3564|nr:DUF2723 domain-containing protein [Alistipes sp. AF48-12]RHO68728.1 DUF2723 domain-containing protein [Alistipes sp. AF48-12]